MYVCVWVGGEAGACLRIPCSQPALPVRMPSDSALDERARWHSFVSHAAPTARGVCSCLLINV